MKDLLFHRGRLHLLNQLLVFYQYSLRCCSVSTFPFLGWIQLLKIALKCFQCKTSTWKLERREHHTLNCSCRELNNTCRISNKRSRKCAKWGINWNRSRGNTSERRGVGIHMWSTRPSLLLLSLQAQTCRPDQIMTCSSCSILFFFFKSSWAFVCTLCSFNYNIIDIGWIVPVVRCCQMSLPDSYEVILCVVPKISAGTGRRKPLQEEYRNNFSSFTFPFFPSHVDRADSSFNFMAFFFIFFLQCVLALFQTIGFSSWGTWWVL